MRHDIEYESDAEYEYECLNCGTTEADTSHPGTCSECGAGMRNRRMPYE